MESELCDELAEADVLIVIAIDARGDGIDPWRSLGDMALCRPRGDQLRDCTIAIAGAVGTPHRDRAPDDGRRIEPRPRARRQRRVAVKLNADRPRAAAADPILVLATGAFRHHASGMRAVLAPLRRLLDLPRNDDRDVAVIVRVAALPQARRVGRLANDEVMHRR